MTGADRPADPGRTQLGLIRALRLVQDADRRLASFEFDPDVVEQLTIGLITADEFRDVTDWPTATGAHVVLCDALGLYPPLAPADLEILEADFTDGGWTRISMRHRPTGIPVRSKAIDSEVAREIACLLLARVVWSEAMARVERRRERDDRRRQLLDRLVLGDVTSDHVIGWIEQRREASDARATIADGLGADPFVAEQLLDGVTSFDAVVREHRDGLLAELAAERMSDSAPQRCPSCDLDLTSCWSRLSPDGGGDYRCPGALVVYEQTTAWQGMEPLESPVPIIGHTYRCSEVVGRPA